MRLRVMGTAQNTGHSQDVLSVFPFRDGSAFSPRDQII